MKETFFKFARIQDLEGFESAISLQKNIKIVKGLNNELRSNYVNGGWAVPCIFPKYAPMFHCPASVQALTYDADDKKRGITPDTMPKHIYFNSFIDENGVIVDFVFKMPTPKQLFTKLKNGDYIQWQESEGKYFCNRSNFFIMMFEGMRESEESKGRNYASFIILEKKND